MSGTSEVDRTAAGPAGVSRRRFLQHLGLGAATAGTALLTGPEIMRAAAASAPAAAMPDAPLDPTARTERVLTTADSEGLLNVYVKDGRIVRLGSLDYPDNEASPMGLNWHHRVYASDRILYPMVRADWKPGGGGNRATRGVPKYRRVTWNEAYDLVAGELKRVKTRYGNEAILGSVIGGWQSAGNLNTKLGQVGRFLNLYGGCTTLIGNKSYACWQWAAPYSWGQMYPDDSMADTLENTKTFIFWASDPVDNWKVRGPSYMRVRNWLAAMKQRGIKMIVIDPLFTQTAEMADVWMPIRPGGDSALMAAMAYVMITENLYSKSFIDTYTYGFEPFRQYVMGETDKQPKTPEWAAGLTDIPADRIRAFAREYAQTPRVKISCARGIQRNDHGEQQVRMLITLAAMKGEFGLPGGGLSFEIPGFAGAGDAHVTLPGPGLFPGVANPVKQVLLDQQFAYSLLNAPVTVHHNGSTYPYPMPGKSTVKLAYWVGGAVLNQHDQINENLRALQTVDTIIVQDSWWTPTARMADIVLPINTVFERNDLTQFWRYVVYQHQIIASLGESKSDFEVFTELSARLGFKDKFTLGMDTADAWLRKLYAAGKIPMSYDRFKQVGYYKLPVDEEGAAYVAFAAFRKDPGANPLNTPSGKIEIYSEAIAKYGYADCPPTPQWMEPFEWLGSAKAKQYPLALITKHPQFRRHSSYDNVDTLHQFSKVNGYEPVWINPADAAARAIKTGDVVRVFNDRGQALAGAVVTPRLRPQVVILHEGAWYRPETPGAIGSLDRGGCANNLTAQRGTSQLAQGPVCHTGLVQIEKYIGGAGPNDWAPITGA
ncbi:MAG TPA: molybdopterin-dependent oxidoreductase [bacterium]|nr:molybdopterin-dependent oxidoreductase [bacterium]